MNELRTDDKELMDCLTFWTNNTNKLCQMRTDMGSKFSGHHFVNHLHIPGLPLVGAVGRPDERVRRLPLPPLDAARVAARQAPLAHANVLHGAQEPCTALAFRAFLLLNL